jgi:hypothetical protein
MLTVQHPRHKVTVQFELPMNMTDAARHIEELLAGLTVHGVVFEAIPIVAEDVRAISPRSRKKADAPPPAPEPTPEPAEAQEQPVAAAAEASPGPAPVESPATGPTDDEMRTVARELARAGKRAALVALLAEFKAESVTQVAAARRQEWIDRARALALIDA